jgi:hypothetical protein
MFGLGQGAGAVVHGTEASLFVNRSGCRLIPNNKLKEPETWEKDRAKADMNVPHGRNFLECIRTRQKPISEIETCVRSSTVLHTCKSLDAFQVPNRLGPEQMDVHTERDAAESERYISRTLEAGSLNLVNRAIRQEAAVYHRG